MNGEPLSEADLVRVASAVLRRVTVKDMTAFLERHAAVAHEQLNGNACSQAAACGRYEQAIQRAVAHLIQHDRRLISNVIRSVAAVETSEEKS
jgi:hypothetical protein